MIQFRDRQSAGKILAKRLRHLSFSRGVIVLGIPRGGVVVAYEVAKALHLALDIVVTRKIGAPGQEELALGAVDPDGEVVWDNELLKQLKLKIENLKLKINDEMEEIKRREETYRQGRKPLDLQDKTVILVDDGVATGATILSAINYLKRHGAKKIILALPVASKEAMDRIDREFGPTSPRFRGVKEFGEMIVLEIPEDFQAVGQFYQQFEVVGDEEVIQLLNGR